MSGWAGRKARGFVAALAVLVVVGCGGTTAPPQGAPVLREPVPLPSDATIGTEPAASSPLATTSPAAAGPAPSEPAAPATSSPPPDSAAPLGPTGGGCPLRALASTAPLEDVAAAFVVAYGTIAAADEQSVRLDCLRSRLSDPLTSPALPPSFTPEQMATNWRLRPTAAPALAVDEDSSQTATHVFLTATLRAQVEQDGADPVPTVSQLLLELINQRGQWLVATVSDRTVTS